MDYVKKCSIMKQLASAKIVISIKNVFNVILINVMFIQRLKSDSIKN